MPLDARQSRMNITQALLSVSDKTGLVDFARGLSACGGRLLVTGRTAMVRSAAKNHEHVGVIVDPADYPAILDEIRSAGSLAAATRFRLAQKAFSHTAAYDAAIGNYLTARDIEGNAAEYPAQFNI